VVFTIKKYHQKHYSLNPVKCDYIVRGKSVQLQLSHYLGIGTDSSVRKDDGQKKRTSKRKWKKHYYTNIENEKQKIAWTRMSSDFIQKDETETFFVKRSILIRSTTKQQHQSRWKEGATDKAVLVEKRKMKVLYFLGFFRQIYSLKKYL
jgi:hypothetical protein